MTREQMHYDVIIVGAGPAGLAAACRLRQVNPKLSVCILEKGAEVGAHILSGAVFDPRALTELFPDWRERAAPLQTLVSQEHWLYLTSEKSALKIPVRLLPKQLNNHGHFVISLGRFCRWLAEQATTLGVDIFPGFAASNLLYNDNGDVCGITTGDLGRRADGSEKSGFAAGIDIHAPVTLLCEGARGHLGKEVIARFALDQGKDPQHYALGIKELWRVPAEQHQPGLVLHSFGWPLSASGTSGGSFLYHLENQQVAVGLITDLSYSNPHLNPFAEFQRHKHHPQLAQYLLGGERIAYGARAITKGGLQSQPRLDFPGGLLVGDDAGTLNFARLKGSHTAMKSGMLAAEVACAALSNRKTTMRFPQINHLFRNSWAGRELYRQRNIGPAQQRWGTTLGAIYSFIDMHCGGKLPWTLHNPTADHSKLLKVKNARPIHYSKPDNQLSFDLLSSVYLSNTHHRDDQPCHLQLNNSTTPIQDNLRHYNEPAQRYCPAGVYDIVDQDGQAALQINAQNCIHCKTCDIKDPAQNITWVTPEAGGGPNYSHM